MHLFAPRLTRFWGFRAEGAAFLEGEGFGFLDFRALGPSRKAAGLQDL